MPVEATHALVLVLALLLLLLVLLLVLLLLLQPAAASVPIAATAMITLLFMGMPLQNFRDLFHYLREPVAPGRSTS
jgi:hypothetical protein